MGGRFLRGEGHEAEWCRGRPSSGTASQFEHDGNGAGVVVGPGRADNRVIMGPDDVRRGVLGRAGNIGDQIGDPLAGVIVRLLANGKTGSLEGPAKIAFCPLQPIAPEHRAFADV